jgi:hypothetical protein
MAQLVVEVVCVAVLAFGLSVTTGSKVSQLIGDNLLSNEIATASEEKNDSRNGVSMIIEANGKMPNEKEDPIDKIDVSVTGEDLGKMGNWTSYCNISNASSCIIYSTFKSKTNSFKKMNKEVQYGDDFTI